MEVPCKSRASITHTPHHITSHISKLPNELLVEIFRSRGSPNDIPLPMLASQVCRHWRQLSLNASFLWSQIDMSWHPLSMIETCIERARSNPLDIHIVLDDYSKPRRHAIKEGLDLIIPEIERWRSLTVEAKYFGSMMNVYMAIRHQYAPQLKDIAMYLSDPFGLEGLWQQSENTYLGILGGGASKLTSLELCGVSLHYCHPPLESLKQLTLTAPCDSEVGLPLSYSKLRDVLQVASGLEKLSLHGRVVCHQENRNRDKVDSVVLPQLQRLEISAPGGESAEDQCEYIDSIRGLIQAPALRTLSLSFLGKVKSSRKLSLAVVPFNSEMEHRPLSSDLLPTPHIAYASILPHLSSPRHCHELVASESSLDDLSDVSHMLLPRISSSLEKGLESLFVHEVDEFRLYEILYMVVRANADGDSPGTKERPWAGLNELIVSSSVNLL